MCEQAMSLAGLTTEARQASCRHMRPLALCLRWRKGNDLTTDMAAMVAGNGRRGQNLDVVKIHAKIVSGVGLRMVCMILS